MITLTSFLSLTSITALLSAPVLTGAKLHTRDCTFQWPAVTGDTCASMASDWDITEVDFVRWNSGVDCNALVSGQDYCLGWEGAEPIQSSSSTRATITGSPSTTRTPTPTSKPPSGPSPTQDGIASNCQRFHLVTSDDTCESIVSRYGTLTLSDFYKWNPAVGPSCTALWLSYYVCIGIPGTPTTKPTTILTTTSSTTKPPTPTGPSPVQEGIAKDCQRFHKVTSTDTCQSIVDAYRTFTLQNFYTWNPAIGNTCQGLWLDYYVCIGVKGTPTKPITTTSTPKPTGSRPTPTQPNVSVKCNKWHKVVEGDVCQSIADRYKITLANFYKWNPDVGSTCKSLWRDYYMCVGSA